MWNRLTAGDICYTSIFAPYTEKTFLGLAKGYGISSVVCPHVCIPSEGRDLEYKDSNQLVLAASELG